MDEEAVHASEEGRGLDGPAPGLHYASQAFRTRPVLKSLNDT